MKIRFIAVSLALICLLQSCSDKYEFLQKMDVAPAIHTDKESLTIRVNDYSDYYKGAGFLKIMEVDSMSSGINITMGDSSGNLRIFYDSLLINSYFPINQNTVVYVAATQCGVYPLYIKMNDKFGKSTQKKIMVTVLADVPPIANLAVTLLNSTNGAEIYKIDGSASTTDMSKICAYSFTIDQKTFELNSSSITYTLYTGSHTIGLTVKDDLGIISKQVNQIINVK